MVGAEVESQGGEGAKMQVLRCRLRERGMEAEVQALGVWVQVAAGADRRRWGKMVVI